ncbi:unnamed protein product [Schistosoma mattheei]|uniref:Uncharacterized protein n=1 Tax=Schistosoma mattheei TaxID=31246 RepID=A0A183NP39_9TREM|nr:unnamed protein product [Schistosoma mattheei]
MDNLCKMIIRINSSYPNFSLIINPVLITDKQEKIRFIFTTITTTTNTTTTTANTTTTTTTTNNTTTITNTIITGNYYYCY